MDSRTPDLRVLSLGGGVQSTCLAHLVLDGSWEAPDLVTFADTGNEPPYVYSTVAELQTRFKQQLPKVEFLVVEKHQTQGIVQDTYHSLKRGARWSSLPLAVSSPTGQGHSRLPRQCTREYKIRPIERAVKIRLIDMGLAKPFQDGTRRIRVASRARVDFWLGISLDEAAQRCKDNPHGWARNRWPLVDLRMTRADCLAYFDRQGLPRPGKSACMICPYHSRAYWQALEQQDPISWGEVVTYDRAIRKGLKGIDSQAFLSQALVPIDEYVLQGQGQQVLPGFESLCDGGYCGI